jgi:K+-sensing histidine kinase KdpD
VRLLVEMCIAEELIRFVVIPAQRAVAEEIRAHCRRRDIGIAVLGHSRPEGVWSFLKDSVSKSLLAELKNMAVWIVQ